MLMPLALQPSSASQAQEQAASYLHAAKAHVTFIDVAFVPVCVLLHCTLSGHGLRFAVLTLTKLQQKNKPSETCPDCHTVRLMVCQP